MYRGQESSIYVIGRSDAGNHETIRPWYSDFTIGKRPGTAAGLRFFRDVEFCTDDENGTGRTITLEAKTQVQADKTAAITVSGSGTLEVTQPDKNENTATLSNTLNLPTGENEVATIRIDGTKLSGGDHTIATVGAGATANVALDPASTALDGRKGSLRVEGGNLVLNVRSKGTLIIVK